MGVAELLIWPFLACLVLTGIHCYLGIHVVGRNVIFVDLAMAQIAFLGSAVTVAILGATQETQMDYAVAAPATSRSSGPQGHRPRRLGSDAPTDRDAATDQPITAESVDALIPPELPTSADASHVPQLPSAPLPGATSANATMGWAHESSAAEAHASALATWKYLGGLLFTLVGAALFALGRLRHRQIPQEAVIGIIYAVSSALALVLLYKAPHDVAEQTRDMLVGRILFVDQFTVIKTAILYAAVGLLHIVLRRPFLEISFQPDVAAARGAAVRWWDFLFYATFGVIVTSSVQMAGILLVFSYLIVPAVCAMLFFQNIAARLCFGWAIGFVGSVLGIGLSVYWDAPTGASIVVAFGVLFLALVLIKFLRTNWCPVR